MRARSWVVASTAGLALSVVPWAAGQVRIAEWNMTNWDAASVTSRGAAFRSALYDVAPNGLQMAPDLLIAEEIKESGGNGQANVNAFLGQLNTAYFAATGLTGDWTAAPYLQSGDTNDTGNALFYRTSKFALLETIALSTNTGSGAGQPPRDTQRWLVRPFGYSVGSTPAAPTQAQIYVYGAHYKAQESGTVDDGRREAEAIRLRNNSNALPPGIGGFLIGADFNLQNSESTSDLSFKYMVEFSVPAGAPRNIQAGQFWDPINTPGAWNNNSAFRYVHTQEPGTGMDDRHDQILVSASLVDRQGLSYIFTPTTVTPANPYGVPVFSTSTWNDANHTYRCWGNDGAHYNGAINGGGVNAQVGIPIANALITTTAGSGHLPVYLDMQVPARLGAPTGTIDFGTVALNAPAQYPLQITNAADVARFSKATLPAVSGIDALTYTLAPTSGFTAPAGTFNRAATAPPAQATSHTITMDTSTGGAKSGTLTITTDDPDNPTRVLQLVGFVQTGSPPDYDVNDDGLQNNDDVYAWFFMPTDVDGDGTIDGDDLIALVATLRAGEIPDITFGRR